MELSPMSRRIFCFWALFKFSENVLFFFSPTTPPSQSKVSNFPRTNVHYSPSYYLYPPRDPDFKMTTPQEYPVQMTFSKKEKKRIQQKPLFTCCRLHLNTRYHSHRAFQRVQLYASINPRRYHLHPMSLLRTCFKQKKNIGKKEKFILFLHKFIKFILHSSPHFSYNALMHIPSSPQLCSPMYSLSLLHRTNLIQKQQKIITLHNTVRDDK